MKYTIWIREDADGNDITRELSRACALFHTKESIEEYAQKAAEILTDDPAIGPLFQQGAILEVADKKNHLIGLQVIGVDDNEKNKKNRKKGSNNYRSYGFITIDKTKRATCSFSVKLVRTGVPG